MAETRTQGAGARSAADVTSLLIELGRSLKARRFYPDDHPARKATLDRSFRAWQAELGRSGALELEVRQGSFRVAGAAEPLGRGPLDELAREFVHHAVRRVRFEPDLGPEGFDALVAVLAMDPDEVQEGGGAERVLYERARDGVTLNAVDYAAISESQARADGPGEPAADHAADGSAEGAGVEAAEVAEEGEPGAPPAQTTDVDPLAQLGGLLAAEGDESNDGALRPETEPDRGAELVGLLRSLDESRDDDAYARLLQRIAAEVAALPDGAAADDAYRVILVLSAHAGESVRSERQRLLAEEGLFQLATGARLDDVVHRACAQKPQPSVRATQILLQLGAHAVPRLFDALLAESEPERRGQLNAILIAMGEKATPEVKRCLESAEDVPRARLAARLAGELQNPGLAPYLRMLLRSGEAPLDLEKEAAKALQRIGGAGAARILAEVVSSQRSELAAVAAHCLGSTGSPRALEVLVTALRRALREDDGDLARETIRALGRLGREEAVPALAEILDKRSLLGRKKLRDLKLAAAAALGRLPGDQASSCLTRVAAGRGDAQVRRAARTALDRRSAP